MRIVKTSEELVAFIKKPKHLSNFLFFPIRPDFRDSKSLLGYYNPLTEKYHSTPLLEFILKAAENYLRKGKEADPFFVLLDEMNLARVEYYFADFLSILEAKKFTSRKEALQNPNFREFLESLNFSPEELNEENFRFSSHGIKLHSEENLKNIPKELFLPPNIYFIGTINVDETTHAIAPKVLDRAFTLEFEVGDLEEYADFLKKYVESKKNKEVEENSEEENIKPSEELKKDFTRGGKFAIIEKETIKEYCDKNPDVVQLLNEINQILKRYGLHFGYRVFDEIVMFLSNSKNSLLELDKYTALDFAIKTKVLPKFSGVRQRLEKPILEILKLFEKRKELEFLNKKKETVKTQTSEEKLENKPQIETINEEPKHKTKAVENPLNVEILQKITSLPWFEKNGTLKVEIENEKEPIEVKTKYPQTVSKLLEMLYKLKTEGFATFIG
jgi:5-methylcytosine-specific restriction endonuclease McrBC GTP-binding regulatory subunit McrB